MKHIQKIVAVLAVVALCASIACLTGCSSDSNKLVIYTEAGFPPYEFVYHNEIVGVDLSIAKAVADELGKELEIVDVNFDNIIGAVQSGKADLGMAGITITEDRKKNVDFSTPYSSTEQWVIVEAVNEIPTLEALAGKSIGVQLGTTSDILVDGLMKDGTLADCTLTQYNTPSLAAAALGKIDAVVTDKLTASIIINASNGKYRGAKFVKADGSDVSEVEEYGVAVAKGNEELLAAVNKVLEKLLSDGTIDKWTEEFNAKATEVGA